MRNTEKMQKLVQYMHAKRMSEQTMKTYTSILNHFFKIVQKDSARISANDVQNYVLNIPEKYSDSFRNQVVNAIKLYFRIIENREFKPSYVPRPNKQQYIPNVLSSEQAEAVIFNTKNLKHRAILFTIYDNGLRISELLNLKIMDVRTKCHTPHLMIRNAKHHSSRTIPLSSRCLELIREYYKQYKPDDYLFPGENGKYSTTSIRNVLQKALDREGIKMRIRVHDLRHSFATNCLVNETNIHHLSQALGHRSVKTTEKVYSHLNIDQVKLNRGEKKEGNDNNKMRIVS